jgi:hypothetical protein
MRPHPNQRHYAGLEREDETKAQSNPCLPDAARMHFSKTNTAMEMRLTDDSWQDKQRLEKGAALIRRKPGGVALEALRQGDPHQGRRRRRVAVAPG